MAEDDKIMDDLVDLTNKIAVFPRKTQRREMIESGYYMFSVLMRKLVPDDEPRNPDIGT
jgi:hypothetical protein